MTTQTLTPAQEAIATADCWTDNAVLPTYTALLEALRGLVLESGGTRGMPSMAPRVATVHAARALLTRHDRTMRGDFRG